MPRITDPSTEPEQSDREFWELYREEHITYRALAAIPLDWAEAREVLQFLEEKGYGEMPPLRFVRKLDGGTSRGSFQHKAKSGRWWISLVEKHLTLHVLAHEVAHALEFAQAAKLGLKSDAHGPTFKLWLRIVVGALRADRICGLRRSPRRGRRKGEP